MSTLGVRTLIICDHFMCEHSPAGVQNSTSVLGLDDATPKTPKKHEFYCKNLVQKPEHRKVHELPQKVNIEEVEEPKKSTRITTRKNCFRPFQDHRRSPKGTIITTKTIHQIEEPEATKIYRQNPCPPAAATPKKSQTKQTCKHETTKIEMHSFRHLSATSI